VKRWQDAAAKWGMLPTKPVHIPEGDLNLLD